MRRKLSSGRRVVRAALLLLLAGTSTVMAGPIVPEDVQTVPVQFEQPATPPASAATFPRIHTLVVRPGYPGEPRDASGRPLFTPQITDGAALDADLRMVSTLSAGQDYTTTPRDGGKHFVRTVRIPAEAAPQDSLDGPANR